MRNGLIRGGILIFETCLEMPAEGSSSPVCRDYLLTENELLQVFQSFRIIFYQEREQRREGEFFRVASLVAQRPVNK